MYNISVADYSKEVYERNNREAELRLQAVMDTYKIQVDVPIYNIEEELDDESNDRSYEAIKNLSWSQCMYPNAVQLINFI